MIPMRISLAARALALAALLATPAVAQERRPLVPLDLYHLRTAGQAALSPDGRSVAYVVTQADSATNKYHRELWIARTDGGGARRLTWLNVSAGAPAFSPDGRQLAFVSAREGKPAQIWILPLAEGGEAWPLTSLETGAGSPTWSPRGDRIAFVSTLTPEQIDSAAAKADTTKADAGAIRRIDRDRAAADRAIRAQLRDQARDDDPIVINRLGYLTETGQRSGDEWDQVYVVDVRPDAKPVRLTSNLWDTGDPTWSPDGQWLAVSSGQSKGEYHPDYEREGVIVILPATPGGQPRQLAEAGYDVNGPEWAPDGRWIAYSRQQVAGDHPTAANNELVLMHPDGSGRVSVTRAMDRSSNAFRWAADGSLYFTVSSEGAVSLYRTRPDRIAPQRIVGGPRGVLGFDVKGQTVAWTQMSPRYPSDVWSAALDGTRERRLTTLNDSLLDRVYVADYEEIRYPSFDGRQVQGWFLRPVGWRAGQRPPPVALEMHGGPHVMWGPGEASMWLEYQALAGAGYTVFFANPRGSDGYGEEWLRAIHQNWGTPPARDILTGVDSVIARGLGDRERQVVTGGSYAGYMTAWLIAKESPDRFKAAVAQRGVYDLTIWWGASNTWRLFEGEFGGRPWEQPELARAQSPLTYVANVKTPLLMLHGALDYRASVSSALAFYRGVKEGNTEVQMVLYPREGHEVTRSGEPAHRVDHMLRIVDWFERHVTH